MSTYAERLNTVLAFRKVSQSELARLIDVKPQVIQYLCNNKAKVSRFTFEIAQVLEVNPEWLATGKQPMIIVESPKDYYKDKTLIPIINWNKLYQYSQNNYDPSTNQKMHEWILVSAENKDCIGLYLSDNSMLPKFEPDSLIIVNSNIDINNGIGKYILAYLDEDKVFLFRKLIKKNDALILLPLNLTSFKEITLTKTDKIIGILVENRTYYK